PLIAERAINNVRPAVASNSSHAPPSANAPTYVIGEPTRCLTRTGTPDARRYTRTPASSRSNVALADGGLAGLVGAAAGSSSAARDCLSRARTDATSTPNA